MYVDGTHVCVVLKAGFRKNLTYEEDNSNIIILFGEETLYIVVVFFFLIFLLMQKVSGFSTS